MRTGLAAFVDFPLTSMDETTWAQHIPCHYVLDDEYVHGACLDTFLRRVHKDLTKGQPGKHHYNKHDMWDYLVAEGAWSPFYRDDLDGEDPGRCVVCHKHILLPPRRKRPQ